jgi:glycosyltransferase involved in cell wall biosynthesis
LTDGVSFIIPIFNKRPFLPQVVAGLKAQRGDFAREFIFIDDGSTDGSREALMPLIAGLPDARVLHHANAGPSVTTNQGLREAHYSLTKLVDGDDVLLPDATERLRRALMQHPEAVVAYGESDYYATADAAMTRLETPPQAIPDDVRLEDALPLFLRECYLGPSNCLIRTEMALAVGGCDEHVFVQDYSLLLRLSTKGPFVATKIPVTLHPQATEGRLNDGGPQLLHDTNLTLLHFLSEHDLPESVVSKTVRRSVTRAWLWAKRREGASIFSSWYLLRLASYLPGRALQLALLRRSNAAFTLSKPVRLSHPV